MVNDNTTYSASATLEDSQATSITVPCLTPGRDRQRLLRLSNGAERTVASIQTGVNYIAHVVDTSKTAVTSFNTNASAPAAAVSLFCPPIAPVIAQGAATTISAQAALVTADKGIGVVKQICDGTHVRVEDGVSTSSSNSSNSLSTFS